LLSKALSHFPEFRFREGRKRLWNPILKKTFANLPEERVRLKLIDYLTLEAGQSSSRISFESPVNLAGDKSSSRTDIICYDSEFKPLLLVECKAPVIKLDEKAAIQVARYNQKVGAPFLLVSNGVLDFWFEVDGDQVQYQHEIPGIFQPKKEVERTFSYWEDRAFTGEKLPPEVRTFVLQSAAKLFEAPHQPIKYLSFDEFSQEFALGHYYRIFGLEEKVKIALSLSANLFGGTRLNGILNHNGENVAFCSISLDLIAEHEASNAEIHSAKGISKIDFTSELSFSFEKELTELIPDLYKLLHQHS
jgi:hypothetical protein